MRTQKEQVRLRERLLANGNKSLYLDIYIDGRRTYEYLKLYLVPERTKEDKQKNIETRRLAEAVKGKRLVEIQNGTFGFEKSELQETNFLDYYRAMCEERMGKESNGNWGNWYSALQHLEKYCRPDTTFKDITTEWVKGFRTYLDNAKRLNHFKDKDAHPDESVEPLSQNSKQSYFRKVKACINQAYKDHIIRDNPAVGVEGFKDDDVERIFLTEDEVKRLAKTPCSNSTLKRAFLFSCLTGIRKSDVQSLHWSQVSLVGQFTRITFKQKKTKGLVYQDINEQATRLMGERGADNEKVFKGFIYNAYTSVCLRRWALEAGITKPITYHSSRHTFALLMLDKGLDFYTLSKLLGHSSINTTMRYSHILDRKKQDAMTLLPDIEL